MKRLIIIAVVLASTVLASCTKENVTPTSHSLTKLDLSGDKGTLSQADAALISGDKGTLSQADATTATASATTTTTKKSK